MQLGVLGTGNHPDTGRWSLLFRAKAVLVNLAYL